MATSIANRITRLRLEGLQAEAPSIEIERQKIFIEDGVETPTTFSYDRTGETEPADLAASIHEALDLAPEAVKAAVVAWAEAQA